MSGQWVFPPSGTVMVYLENGLGQNVGFVPGSPQSSRQQSSSVNVCLISCSNFSLSPASISMCVPLSKKKEEKKYVKHHFK